MKYITGKHALNLPCALETCGDWHCSALAWRDITTADSDTMPFGEYGIEPDKKIPNHEGRYFVANHIRALLDLIYFGNFAVADGMCDDFICNSKYDTEIFNKVSSLKNEEKWDQIDLFMSKEYKLSWLQYKERHSI